MRKLNFKNCLVAFFSVGCLALIAMLIAIIILVRNLYTSAAPSLNLFGLLTGEVNRSKQIDTRSTHLGPKDKEILLELALVSDSENDWENMEKALNEAKKQNISTVIHLGDITHLGVLSDLARARDIFKDSGLTIYSVPGDRDLWKSGGVSGFEDFLGNSYRVVELEGVILMLIDNSNEYEGVDKKQWQFIRDNVQKADFIFLHNPVYFDRRSILGQKGMGQYSTYVDEQRKRLLSLVRESSVKAVFAGDQHFFSGYADESDADLDHFVVGSLSLKRNLQSPNFAILTIYEDKDYFVRQVIL